MKFLHFHGVFSQVSLNSSSWNNFLIYYVHSPGLGIFFFFGKWIQYYLVFSTYHCHLQAKLPTRNLCISCFWFPACWVQGQDRCCYRDCPTFAPAKSPLVEDLFRESWKIRRYRFLPGKWCCIIAQKWKQESTDHPMSTWKWKINWLN